MLSDWHSDSKMVIWESRAKILVSQDNINANNCVLWIFGALE